MDKEVIKKLQEALSKKSINVIVGNIHQMMAVWKSWYRGSVNDFHYYNRKKANGTITKCERLTLSMAKKISEDWASMLMTENTVISTNNDIANEYLKMVLTKNNFFESMTKLIENSFAIGTGLLTEYIKENEIKISFIKGDNLLITDSENGIVNGVCEVNEIIVGNEKYQKVTHHLIKNNIYKKQLYFFNSNMNEVYGNFGVDEEYIKEDGYYIEYETTNPFFQIVTPNIENNFDDSAYGISIYANSIDILKSCDMIYDGNNTEFKLSRKRVVVNSKVLKEKINFEDEGYIRYFDAEDEVYQSIGMNDAPPITQIQFNINQEEFEKGIKQQIGLLGFKCGLGSDYYSFEGQKGVTATEVVSRNSDTYRNKSKHERILKRVLIDMMKSIIKLGYINDDLKIDADALEYKIKFDDSIINDDEANYQKDLIKLEKGIISKQTFRERWEPNLNSLEEEQRIKKEQEEELEIFGNDIEVEEDIE